MVRLNRPSLSRPFALRVDRCEAAGEQSWLILQASGNVHAVGTVRHYDAEHHRLVADMPLPHARPYVYRYDSQTGMPRAGSEETTYNGAYNGFWLVAAGQNGDGERVMVKNLTKNRTEFLLYEHQPLEWKAGDRIEIQLLAPGDELEIPAWAEVQRGTDGQWQINGPARASVGD